MISGNDTPATVGAADGDELTCFIDYKYKTDILGNSKTRTPATTIRRPVTPAMPRPVAPRTESDQEYANREFNTGKYTAALCEVRDHRVLSNKFLEKLGACDQRLANVCFLH